MCRQQWIACLPCRHIYPLLELVSTPLSSPSVPAAVPKMCVRLRGAASCVWQAPSSSLGAAVRIEGTSSLTTSSQQSDPMVRLAISSLASPPCKSAEHCRTGNDSRRVELPMRLARSMVREVGLLVPCLGVCVLITMHDHGEIKELVAGHCVVVALLRRGLQALSTGEDAKEARQAMVKFFGHAHIHIRDYRTLLEGSSTVKYCSL